MEKVMHTIHTVLDIRLHTEIRPRNLHLPIVPLTFIIVTLKLAVGRSDAGIHLCPLFLFWVWNWQQSPVSALGGPAAITDQDLKFQFSYIAACSPRQVRPAYMVSDCTEPAFVAPCKTNRSHTWMCLYLLTSYLTISSLVPTQNKAWVFLYVYSD